MKKQIQIEGYIQLSEVKPEVGKGGIFFPVSVKHENLDKYGGDARSFGYHFDDGYCSIIEFEQAVGVLAEDTIELFEQCQDIKKQLNKPHHSSLEITDRSVKCDTKNAELLIRYGEEFFYKDEHGYFFVTKYYCYGEPQRVTKESGEKYREINFEYQKQVKKYNKLMKEALENIELLKKTID